MTRTAMRPISRGTVSRLEALVFGLVLAGAAVAVLAFAVNLVAAVAVLLAFAIFFYVVVYTVWLKRRTPRNIVIGGAAGALPPVIGWAATTRDVALQPLVLFLIVLWTPPHFWALSLNRWDEYARAGIPMVPVVAGRDATTRQILVYSVLLAAVSILPWLLGLAGPLYGAASVCCGAIFVVLAEAEHDAVAMPAASLVHDRLVAMAARGWAGLDWSALGLLPAVAAGLGECR